MSLILINTKISQLKTSDIAGLLELKIHNNSLISSVPESDYSKISILSLINCPKLSLPNI